VYDPVPLPELELKHKWSMWEHYEVINQMTANFEDQMQIVCWFHDLIGFAKAWNSIPHKDVSNFFYNKKTNKVPM
jgi:hypothetical protein